MTNALTIPEADEADIRCQCLAAATALNAMRDEPHIEMSEVVADAALAEFYVTNGETVAIYCAERFKRTFRG